MQRKNKAQALIMVFMVVIFALILLGPMISKSVTERYLLRRQELRNEAFYLAEGAIEDSLKKFTNAIANYQISTNVTRYPADPSQYINTTFSSSAIFPGGVTANSYIAEAFSTENGWRTVIDPDGYGVFAKVYISNATVVHPLSSDTRITLKRVFVRRIIPTFQHAVFYNDDLEIIPGANMNFTGRIHSNKDMYLAADGSTKTLTIDGDYVHSAGAIYNMRKDSSANMTGKVSISKLGTSDFVNMNGFDSRNANWTTGSQSSTYWNGTVKSSVHGVTELSAPAVGSIQPDGYYSSQAAVKIENGVIKEGATTLVEGKDIPSGTIVTDSDFYNNREAKYVRMTNINLRKLGNLDNATCTDGVNTYTCPNHLPSNGLLYATRNDAPGGQQPGIRLVNGTEIARTGGLTVVSNDPVYIQGDYNTVNKKPAAVFCDAVNLLSNSWNDSYSTSWTNRIASATTINSAFISGVDTTTSGHYNGGLENYPRLHENWSAKTLTIKGSFVELWNSQIASGAWVYGNPYYTAPNRNWSYDNDFSTGNLPPFTPWAVEAQRSAWWEE